MTPSLCTNPPCVNGTCFSSYACGSTSVRSCRPRRCSRGRTAARAAVSTTLLERMWMVPRAAADDARVTVSTVRLVERSLMVCTRDTVDASRAVVDGRARDGVDGPGRADEEGQRARQCRCCQWSWAAAASRCARIAQYDRTKSCFCSARDQRKARQSDKTYLNFFARAESASPLQLTPSLRRCASPRSRAFRRSLIRCARSACAIVAIRHTNRCVQPEYVSPLIAVSMP